MTGRIGDRPANGGFNSRKRLDHERQVFFSTQETNEYRSSPLYWTVMLVK